MLLRLTKREVPAGSIIAVLSDIHIPHHDEAAVEVAISCCEDVGATHVVLNGDIADCGPASRHAGKKSRDSIDLGTLADSVVPGRWIIDWARTRPCWKIRGNHLAWVEDKIAEDPALSAVTPEALLDWPESGDGWTVLPSQSELRLGSLVMCHGDSFFKSGSGGANPAATILRRAPHQTTLCGHVHRMSAAWSTSKDESGIDRTHAAWTAGHLSIESSHAAYMGNYTNWQQSFFLVGVFWDEDRPRFDISSVQIHRTKRNQPVIYFRNKVYR